MLSNNWGTEVSFSSIYIKPIKNISINDLLIKDQDQDTLFYVKRFNAHIDSVSVKNKCLYFGRLNIDELKSKVSVKDQRNNFSFIIDSLKRNSTGQFDWKFRAKELWIRNSSVQYFNAINRNVITKFNSNDIGVNGFNLFVDQIEIIDDSLSLRIKKLTFEESSGVNLESLKCNIGYGAHGLGVTNLRLQSEGTYLSLQYFNLWYDSFNDFENYWDEPRFKVKINSLSTDSKEIRHFFNKSPAFKNRLQLKGAFSGTLNDFKGKNVHINMGTGTSLNANFQLTGLSNIEDAYVFFNIKKLSTNPVDITKIISLNNNTKNIIESAAFEKIGDVDYKGKISGFINDLVAYGEFTTDLGKLSTDIGVKATDNNKIVYSGKLSTSQFNFGELFNSQESLNTVALSLSVNGYRTADKQYRALIGGRIDSIDIRNYKYEHVNLSGYLSNTKFNGSVKLEDPNANVEFNGHVDFSNEVTQFDFVADVNTLKLAKLNFFPKFPDSDIAFNITASLRGETANTMLGNIALHNGHIITSEQEFELDSLSLNMETVDDVNYLTLNSDLIEGELKGHYDIRSIPKEVQYYLYKTLPSIFPAVEGVQTFENDVEFYLQTKKMASFLKVVSPDAYVADGSLLRGELNSEKQTVQLDADFKSLSFNNINGNGVKLKLEANTDDISTTLNFDEIKYSDFVALKNFSISQKSASDSIDIRINWDFDKASSENRGEIKSNIRFKRALEGKLYSRIKVLPSNFVVNDSIWTIQESNFNIMPNGLNVDAFRVFHRNQEFNMNGMLTNSYADLLINIQNVDLEKISGLQTMKRIKLAGLMNASFQILESNINPVVSSEVKIDNLDVNNELIGDFSSESVWNKQDQEVKVSAQIVRDNKKLLDGGGYFKPKEKDYNFDFKLDSLPVGFLNLYLNKIIQDIKGTASGNIGLRNTDAGVGLDGKVGLNHVNFNVDLVKCRYFVDDSIILKPADIIFEDMAVTDIYGENGLFKGSIKHTNFKDMMYDLTVRVDNMLVLDTKEIDNEMYYGTVFGTGDLFVTGATYDMSVDIKARNERNSKLFIPLDNNSASLNNNFIQFYNPSAQLDDNIDESDNSYVAERNNYELHMDFEINPDAEIQVIFDPTVGDLLKSNGRGDLQINMDKDKDITFFGEYTVIGGDYFFSLENVINKRFNINNGGSITWQGDPYNAIIDLTATYKIKTSIAPLIQTGVYGSDDLSGEASRRVPIHCDLILGEQLTRPSVRFEINAPTLEQTNQNLIQDAISTEEELNRQVLSLLVLNKFYAPEYSGSRGSQGQGVGTAVNANASEVLSSQVSNLLSQISKDVDVGVAYRPEDDISREEIEVALSTQLFNDRVTINGNVEYGKYSDTAPEIQQSASNIVGDFDMDIKLNKKGSLRAKVYTKSNDDYSYDSSPSTQGIGISYQEDFNTFGELFHKYWSKITGKGKLEKEQEIEEE